MTSRKIIAGILSFGMIVSMSGCGSDSSSSDTSSENDTKVITTTVSDENSSEKETEATASSDTFSDESSDESLAETPAETSEESSEPAEEKPKETKPYRTDEKEEEVSASDLSADEAKVLLFDAAKALKESDWDAVIDKTNFLELCELSGEKLTKEEAIEAINSGAMEGKLDEYEQSVSSFELTDETVGEAQRLTAEELSGLSDTVNLLSQNKVSQTFEDGYRFPMTAENKIGFYVLKYPETGWKMDIAIGMATDAFAYLKEYGDQQGVNMDFESMMSQMEKVEK